MHNYRIHVYVTKNKSPNKNNNKAAVVQGELWFVFLLNLFGSNFIIIEYNILVIKKEYIVLHMEFEWAPQWSHS